MDDNGWLAGAAGALPVVGGVVSALINNANSNATNAANRQFALTQQQQQNDYNREMWQEQMAYNSPQATMQRFEAAGLNPNLIAGQVSGGYASMPPMSAKADYVATPHPSVDFGKSAAEGLQAFNDVRLGSAQVSNISAQAANSIADAALKGMQQGLVAAQTANTQAQTGLASHQAAVMDSEVAKNAADTNRITSLLPYEIQLNQLTGAKTAADTTYALDSNMRAAAMQSYSIQEAISRISQIAVGNAKTEAEADQIRAQTQIILGSKALQDMDVTMRQNGMMPHDNAVLRAISGIFSPVINTAGGTFQDHRYDYVKRNSDGTYSMRDPYSSNN